MATGALDANGIWQYGEDDSNTTFSALLNRLGSSTSTQQGSNKTRLTALEAKPLSGLVPIVAPTINNTGGTVTANALGQISFSNVTSFSPNGVFTSAYKNYRIIINLYGSINFVVPALRLRAAGTDLTTTNYYYAGYVARDTGSLGSWTSSGGTLLNLGAAIPSRGFIIIDVGGPAEAQVTPFNVSSQGYDNTSTLMLNYGGRVNLSNSYDGFTIFSNTAGQTIYGEAMIYGYND